MIHGVRIRIPTKGFNSLKNWRLWSSLEFFSVQHPHSSPAQLRFEEENSLLRKRMSCVSYSCNKYRSICFSFCQVPPLALLTFTCDLSWVQSLLWTEFPQRASLLQLQRTLLQTAWNFCTKKSVYLNHYLS